jgi:hypothetical protein
MYVSPNTFKNQPFQTLSLYVLRGASRTVFLDYASNLKGNSVQ